MKINKEEKKRKLKMAEYKWNKKSKKKLSWD
jgi:hypothetical protein